MIRSGLSTALVVFVLLYVPFGPARIDEAPLSCWTVDDGQVCQPALRYRVESVVGFSDGWLLLPVAGGIGAWVASRRRASLPVR